MNMGAETCGFRHSFPGSFARTRTRENSAIFGNHSPLSATLRRTMEGASLYGAALCVDASQRAGVAA